MCIRDRYELPCKIWSFWLENWLSYAQFNFWRPFCFLAAIFWRDDCGRSRSTCMQNLELVAWKMSELCSIYFWRPFLRRVNMNFHAKSGASSLKIDWVILSLIFGGHFVFWRSYFFLKGWLRAVKIYLHAKSRACSLKNEWVMLNLIFGGHFVFWRPFCF